MGCILKNTRELPILYLKRLNNRIGVKLHATQQCRVSRRGLALFEEPNLFGTLPERWSTIE